MITHTHVFTWLCHSESVAKLIVYGVTGEKNPINLHDKHSALVSFLWLQFTCIKKWWQRFLLVSHVIEKFSLRCLGISSWPFGCLSSELEICSVTIVITCEYMTLSLCDASNKRLLNCPYDCSFSYIVEKAGSFSVCLTIKFHLHLRLSLMVIGNCQTLSITCQYNHGLTRWDPRSTGLVN